VTDSNKPFNNEQDDKKVKQFFSRFEFTAPEDDLKSNIENAVQASGAGRKNIKTAPLSSGIWMMFALAACALAAVLYFTFYWEQSNRKPLDHSTYWEQSNRKPFDHSTSDDTIKHNPEKDIQMDSPMFGGNAARTGYYEYGLGKRRFGQKNQTIVYVGSLDMHLYAADSESGKVLWKFETEGVIQSTPVVVNGVIFVVSDNDHLYALNARNGTELWRFKEIFWQGTPAVSGNKVYVGTKEFLYALDAKTGEEKWKHETRGCIKGTPAVANNMIFVGSNNNALSALDAKDGKELWSFNTGGSVHSSPAVVDGVVYVGCRDRFLYALNAKDGEIVWSFETGGIIRSSPAVVDGVVYVGSYDGFLYALTAKSGEELWEFKTQDYIQSSPAVVDGAVYVGSADEHLYALNAKTGNMLWKARTGTKIGGNVILGSPAVARGKVYVGTYKDPDPHLYAFDAKTGEEVWNLNTGGKIFGSPAVASNGPIRKSVTDIQHAVSTDDTKPKKQLRPPFLTLSHAGNVNYGLYGSSDSGKSWKTLPIPKFVHEILYKDDIFVEFAWQNPQGKIMAYGQEAVSALGLTTSSGATPCYVTSSWDPKKKNWPKVNPPRPEQRQFGDTYFWNPKDFKTLLRIQPGRVPFKYSKNYGKTWEWKRFDQEDLYWDLLGCIPDGKKVAHDYFVRFWNKIAQKFLESKLAKESSGKIVKVLGATEGIMALRGVMLVLSASKGETPDSTRLCQFEWSPKSDPEGFWFKWLTEPMKFKGEPLIPGIGGTPMTSRITLPVLGAGRFKDRTYIAFFQDRILHVSSDGGKTFVKVRPDKKIYSILNTKVPQGGGPLTIRFPGTLRWLPRSWTPEK